MHTFECEECWKMLIIQHEYQVDESRNIITKESLHRHGNTLHQNFCVHQLYYRSI